MVEMFSSVARCIYQNMWLSGPQTTPTLGLSSPRSTAPQLFCGYSARCRSVVLGKGGHSCRSLEIIARMWQPLALKMSSQENRVPVKVAVAAAIAYVKELYEGISLRDLLLEEIEYSDASDKWLVTIGFSLPETKEVSTSVILPSSTSRELSRRYKTVIIDAASGDPDSMKIRTV